MFSFLAYRTRKLSLFQFPYIQAHARAFFASGITCTRLERPLKWYNNSAGTKGSIPKYTSPSRRRSLGSLRKYRHRYHQSTAATSMRTVTSLGRIRTFASRSDRLSTPYPIARRALRRIMGTLLRVHRGDPSLPLDGNMSPTGSPPP